MRFKQISFAFISFLLVSLSIASDAPAQEYPYGPDSSPQDVPHGKVSEKMEIVSAKAFPGVHHEYWVYVPAQYDGKTPAAVMVFNDGGGFTSPDGPFRVPVVFDNLIAKKQMPITIAIMINPGVILPADEKTQLPRYTRSYEYDACSDRYARFLVDELLPKIALQYKLTDDPNLRAICGSSSGGSCAFTAAWERPDAFRRVVSFIGSFTNLRGANQYADLIRKTEPKPIRVFQQDGEKDLNGYAGSWYLANQDIASALEWAGYAHRFDTGTTNHDAKQSGPLFPEAMKWVWQDYDKPIAVGVNSKQPVQGILMPGEDWQIVSEGHKFTEGTTADADGHIYFTDIPNNQIWRIGTDGKLVLFASDTEGANGLKIGPNGRLYACQEAGGRVVAYDAKTAEKTIIAEGFERPNDLVITHGGDMYVTEPHLSQVWHISADGGKKLVVEKKNGIVFSNGIGLTPDQSQLIVDDTKGSNFWIFGIAADGSLTHGAPFYTAQIASTDRESGADGLCLDREGRLYVTTRLGLQIFDQAGRVIGIINKPQDAKVRNQWLANVTFGGKNFDELYIACGDKVYRRKTKAKGSFGLDAPTKPEKPRL